MRNGSARALLVGLLFCVLYGLPATGVHAEEAGEANTPPEAAAPDEASTDTASTEAEEPFFADEDDAAPAGKSKLRRGTEIGMDVLIVRPLSLATVIAGAGFVYPASVLAAPNSMSVRQEVVDVLWTIPLENLTERKLGEI